MGTGERTRQPRWEIADVLARTDLSQLLDELATLATRSIRGRRWHCPMPDHDDQHASVTMHTDHRGHERWRCWSGDNTHRGDAIDLIVATQRVNRADAIAWLANRAGMIPDQPLPPARRKPQRARPSVVPLDASVVRYVHACEKILWGHTGAPVRDWLHARGFDDDLLRANHVGADPGRAMMSRQRGLPHGHSLAATFPRSIQRATSSTSKPATSSRSDPTSATTRPAASDRTHASPGPARPTVAQAQDCCSSPKASPTPSPPQAPASQQSASSDPKRRMTEWRTSSSVTPPAPGDCSSPSWTPIRPAEPGANALASIHR